MKVLKGMVTRILTHIRVYGFQHGGFQKSCTDHEINLGVLSRTWWGFCFSTQFCQWGTIVARK